MVLGLLCASLPAPTEASLTSPSVHALVCTPDGAAVTVGKRHLWFRGDGAFVAERSLEMEGEPVEGRLVAVGAGGDVWLMAVERGADGGGVAATRLIHFDAADALVAKTELEGAWHVRADAGGVVYVGRPAGEELAIERVDAGSGERLPVLRLSIEGGADSWALDPDGGVWVLTRQQEAGLLRHFDAGGRLLAQATVRPDPMTSVAHVNGVSVDAEGAVYASHGSWEVSSAIGDAGSVMRVDPVSGAAERLTQGVGYLLDFALCGDTLFVRQLGDEILRFSREGAQLGRFVAVPPQYGESWEEREERWKRAAEVGPEAAPAELVAALVYGAYERQGEIRGWLVARGASALPAVMQGMAAYPGAHTVMSAAGSLFGRWPEAAAAAFAEASPETRRAAAVRLAWELKQGVPALEETLLALALGGGEGARFELIRRGAPPALVAKLVADFRSAHRSRGRTDSAEWDLVLSWPEAFDAVQAIVADPADPERAVFRALALEATLRAARDERKEGAVAAARLRERIAAWAQSPDAFVRETGAVALTSLGVRGFEDAALAAWSGTPDLGAHVGAAFAELAARDPAAVESRAQRLFAAAASQPEPEARRYGPLHHVCGVATPSLVHACLGAVRAAALPPGARGEILLALKAAAVPRDELLAAFEDLSWQRPLVDEPALLRFVEEALEALTEDAEARRAVKAAALTLLPAARLTPGEDGMFAPLSFWIRALEPFLDENDVPALLPLLDAPEPGARREVLEALSAFPPTPELQSRLLPLLEDAELALSAAQALGRVGHSAALPVLAEQGLKRLGLYSHVRLDVASFAPYGRAAEETLLELADYPNSGTRYAVRELLLGMGSAEGARLVQAEFDAALAAVKLPEVETLGFMLKLGRDPVPGLLSVALARPEAVAGCGCVLSSSTAELRPRLEAAILAEVDVSRARALGALARGLLGNDAEAWLVGVRARHPLPEVREALAGPS